MASPVRALVRLVALVGLAAGLLSMVPAASAADGTINLSGRVVDLAGKPVSGLTVRWIEPDPGSSTARQGSTRTAADGTYRLTPPADVRFVVCVPGTGSGASGTDARYVGTCWTSRKPAGATPYDPDRVKGDRDLVDPKGDAFQIGLGTDRTGIDFAVGAPARVSGVVRTADGAVAAGRTVTVYSECGATCADSSTSVTTDQQGRYDLTIADPTASPNDYCLVVRGGEKVCDLRYSIGQTYQGQDYEIGGDVGSVVNLETPYWVGTPRVGWTITAVAGKWSPSDVSVSFEWLAGGRVVGRGDTFVPTTALIGDTITLEATASRRGYESATRAFERPDVVFDGSPPAAKSVDNTETAYFVGTPKVGWTLSARAGKWTPASVKVTYEWFTGSRRLASGDSYVPVAADLGRVITLRATAAASGYRDGTVTWTNHVAVAKGEIFVSGQPTVSGTARVGKTLTARARGASPKAATSYRWLRGGKPISGATRSTYRLVAADRGKKISVKASYTAPGYLDTYRTSKATATVR